MNLKTFKISLFLTLKRRRIPRPNILSPAGHHSEFKKVIVLTISSAKRDTAGRILFTLHSCFHWFEDFVSHKAAAGNVSGYCTEHSPKGSFEQQLELHSMTFMCELCRAGRIKKARWSCKKSPWMCNSHHGYDKQSLWVQLRCHFKNSAGSSEW